jgi:hypothetical protein
VSRMFSGPEAAAWLGMPYPTLDNWLRRYKLARPTVEASGPGSRRRFTMLDLARVAVLRAVDSDAFVATALAEPKSARLYVCAQTLAGWPDLPRFVVVTDNGTHQADTAAEAVDIVLATPGVSTVVDVAKVLVGCRR